MSFGFTKSDTEGYGRQIKANQISEKPREFKVAEPCRLGLGSLVHRAIKSKPPVLC